MLRFPHLSSLQRTAMYASLLRISGALHLSIFEQTIKFDCQNAYYYRIWRLGFQYKK